jgi:prepilin-type N-terminal cleavage/methylation domain-containing protein
MKSAQTKSGFTLIELLITVSIIGVLSGLLLGVINVSGIRSKARDSERIADLKKIQAALELYLADNRRYPPSSASGGLWIDVADNDALTSAIVPNYINEFPEDPSYTGSNGDPCNDLEEYRYNYASDGTFYILTANMEVEASTTDSPCTGLYNWNTSLPDGDRCGGAPETYCYGVQNP